MDVRDFHPKRKGSLGEAMVAAELIRQRFPVFTEFGDLSRVDLIAELPDGRLVKIQVKCRRSKRGAVVVDRRKCGPGYRFDYRVGDVDVFAVYVYDRDELLFIPARVICGERRQTTFRLDPPRNGQESNIRLAADFSSFQAAVERSTPP